VGAPFINGPKLAAALAFPTSIPVTFALRDMSQELEGVASCFNLVVSKSRSLRERMGLSLARVGVERNMRAFQALRILLEDPAPEPRQVTLNTIVEHTVQGFDEELRLTGSRVSVDLSETAVRLHADARTLAIIGNSENAVRSCLEVRRGAREQGRARDLPRDGRVARRRSPGRVLHPLIAGGVDSPVGGLTT